MTDIKDLVPKARKQLADLVSADTYGFAQDGSKAVTEAINALETINNKYEALKAEVENQVDAS